MIEKYTISQLSEILGISIQATNKKVDKLKSQGLKTTKELINGRLTTLVVLANDELKALIEKTNLNKPVYQTLNQVDQPGKPVEIKVDKPEYNKVDEEFLKTLMQELIQSKNQLINYAEQVGQVKLLEDKSKEYREDLKFYQDEYFKMKYEVERLTQLNKQLENANKQFQLKCDHLNEKIESIENENKSLIEQLSKKTPFFGIFKR